MLDFLYYAVSWVLLRWHSLMNVIGLDPAGGANWRAASSTWCAKAGGGGACPPSHPQPSPGGRGSGARYAARAISRRT